MTGERNDRLKLPTVLLRGVRIHAVREAEVIDTMMSSLDEQRGGWIITLNLAHMRQCEVDQEYRDIADEADLVVVDGMPLVWASKLQRTPVPARVPGSDLVSSVAQAAAKHDRSIFFLGGDGDAATDAGEILQSRYPGLCVAGVNVPPFGFDQDEEQVEAIVRELEAAQPDIVYVALGSPKQERLIRRIRHRLPATWWIGVGISFSFLSGDLHRAPSLVQKLGLEWMHRLVQEPKKLYRRYLIEGIPYAARLLTHATMNGLRTNGDAKTPPVRMTL